MPGQAQPTQLMAPRKHSCCCCWPPHLRSRIDSCSGMLAMRTNTLSFMLL